MMLGKETAMLRLNVVHRQALSRPQRLRSCRKVRATAQSVCATLVGPGPRLAVADGSEDEGSAAADQKLHGRLVEEAAMWRQIELQQRFPNGPGTPEGNWSPEVLAGAYVRCGEVTADYAKTFYLGTQLMTPEQARAVWAIYVWCRRTDELVDGPNASRITPEALDRWEERLESLFEGRPYDILDAALTNTVAKFPLDIQPFRDMIEGMRMDMRKSRYETFDELYEYCYRVAGTVALMTCPVMGMDPSYKGPLEPVYRTALALGTANQLTNILRDVGEDIRERNRIYLPLEELARFGIQEEELLSGLHAPSTGRMDDRWQAFMSWQIERAHSYFRDAEAGVTALSPQARWPVFSALDLYRRILNAIEDNGYDNFTQRAYVPRHVKMMQLPFAFLKGLNPPMFAPEAVARFQSLSPRAKSAQLLAVQDSDAGLEQTSALSQ